MECVCQDFYQLSEINATVSYVVEYGLAAVTLIFYIANLHFQSEIFGNLTGPYHSIVFQCFGLIVFFNVNFACLSVYAPDFRIGFKACFLHLEQYQPSGKCHSADVVSGRGFDSHYITFLKGKFIGIEVESFPGVLELHLYHVRIIFGAGYAFQIIEGVELTHVPAASFTADSTTSRGEYIIIAHSLLF